MIRYNTNARRARRRSAPLRVCLLIGASLWLAACGKDEAPADAATAPAANADAAKPAVTPDNAVSDKVNAMSTGDLREAARKAYGENRLYAPAGDNAVEYYLALREKSPGDAAVSSALIDLLPMTVIAIEQSVNREDFAEAQRLLALLEKAEPQHPALARLESSITARKTAAAERARQEKLTAEQEAERQAELEAQRIAEQRAQQQAAARQLAAQQAAEAEAAKEREAAEAAEAERLAAEQRAAEQRRQAALAAAAAKPTAADLRPLSTPAPQYPPRAYRAGRSGEVQVEFTVGVDGSVTDARIVRSEPARVFDRETLDAVRRWRFQPLSAPVTTRRTIGFKPAE